MFDGRFLIFESSWFLASSKSNSSRIEFNLRFDKRVVKIETVRSWGTKYIKSKYFNFLLLLFACQMQDATTKAHDIGQRENAFSSTVSDVYHSSPSSNHPERSFESQHIPGQHVVLEAMVRTRDLDGQFSFSGQFGCNLQSCPMHFCTHMCSNDEALDLKSCTKHRLLFSCQCEKSLVPVWNFLWCFVFLDLKKSPILGGSNDYGTYSCPGYNDMSSPLHHDMIFIMSWCVSGE